ncbi:MAG: hypothetical protein R3Y39_04495 [Rikenellaceae bacterium]
MKKVLLILAVILSVAYTSSAQTFKKGAQVASAGGGYSDKYGFPISIEYERGIIDINEKSSIGIGGYVAYASKHQGIEYKSVDCGLFNNHDIFVAIAGNYHYTAKPKWDLYGGFRIGYDFRCEVIEWDDDALQYFMDDEFPKDGDGIAYDVHVGARYYPLRDSRRYMLRNIAFKAEVGYGISIASLGLSYKF